MSKGKFMKVHAAWADVGSHGGVFEFWDGPVGKKYPRLMHIFSTQTTEDLVPVYVVMRREWRDKTEELRDLRRRLKVYEGKNKKK